MDLSIAFTPAEVALLTNHSETIYVVIDVIRATTSITILLDRGAKRLYVAETIEQARQASILLTGCLLCGEYDEVSQTTGFDLGNEPSRLAQANVQGKELILSTTNGTRAFFACPPSSLCLAGGFYNAQCVMALALHLAQARESHIMLVCSGEYATFALDDAYCAGTLARTLMHSAPDINLHESVYAAFALCQTYTAESMLKYCRSAQSVRLGGMGQDLDLCLTMNASANVAQVVGKEPTSGLLILEPCSLDNPSIPYLR